MADSETVGCSEERSSLVMPSRAHWDSGQVLRLGYLPAEVAVGKGGPVLSYLSWQITLVLLPTMEATFSPAPSLWLLFNDAIHITTSICVLPRTNYTQQWDINQMEA